MAVRCCISMCHFSWQDVFRPAFQHQNRNFQQRIDRLRMEAPRWKQPKDRHSGHREMFSTSMDMTIRNVKSLCGNKTPSNTWHFKLANCEELDHLTGKSASQNQAQHETHLPFAKKTKVGRKFPQSKSDGQWCSMRFLGA